MRLNIKQYCMFLCVVSAVLLLSVGTCSAADARFEMKNQNGMPIGEDGYFPLPLDDYLTLTAFNQGSISSFNWTIRDSTEEVVFSYNGTSPSIVFPGVNPGFYTANLEISDDPEDTGSETRSFLIADSYFISQAYFSSSTDYEVSPANVTIFDLSQTSSPVLGWWWSVNGEEVSGFDSPIINQDLHPGIHEVNLSIAVMDPEYGIGTSSISKPVNVSIDRRLVSGEVKANFTAIRTLGDAPLNVQFIDLSSGNAVAWNWDFGDGKRSSEKSPMHTYMRTGAFTVKLDVYNQQGEKDSITRSGFVKINKYSIINQTKSL